jgi:GntR family transcriptional regulator, rspAB operon transcriptional repressor
MHGRIIALAGNSRLASIMSQLGDQVHRFGLLTLRHGRVEPALQEHGRIIDALVAGQGGQAERMMRLDLRADRDMAIRDQDSTVSLNGFAGGGDGIRTHEPV